MEFILHSNLAKKLFVADLPLCRVLMVDDRQYPWLLLVPRRLDVSRMMDVSIEDQLPYFYMSLALHKNCCEKNSTYSD